MAELCGLFGVSKQAYYQYDEDAALAKASREEFALQYVKDIHKLDPGMGIAKIWEMYRKEFSCDYPIGRDRFCRIAHENGQKVRLKIAKPRTTDSTHGLPVYPNLIKSYIPTAANQLWVSDITYIVIMDDDRHYHFCYLSLFLDAYTEEIVGWSVGPTLDTQYPIEASKTLLDLANDITKMDKESFVGAFSDWYETYKDIVNERVQDRRIKRVTPPYMRPRLRSAYLSLKRNMPLLWTFYDHPETGLPNTNNGIEGLFSDLKTKVRVHSGICRENRKKLLDEYIKRNY